MAGLSAAVRARELGAAPVVYEKGTRAGGSMLLSSCVIWRFREWQDFRAECPDGDERLQRTVWEQLDDGIAWLESLGAPVVAHDTGNPRTIGKRFDPRGLTDVLVRAAGEVRLGEAASDPAILATGGFQGDAALVGEYIRPGGSMRLRANPWSAGDGLRFAVGRGAQLSAGMDEFYGRNMPDAPFGEADFVPAAQLYAARAQIVNERGEEFLTEPVDWSETRVVEETARQPGAKAVYLVDPETLLDEDVARRVEYARRLGATVVPTFEGALAPAIESEFGAAVHVRATITHTIGGLRIDDRARVVGADGLWAAGADAGGISTGGYASGLASALVLGLTAAEDALS
jgi:fumarate reductase flavoprotein subunit